MFILRCYENEPLVLEKMHTASCTVSTFRCTVKSSYGYSSIRPLIGPLSLSEYTCAEGESIYFLTRLR